MRIRLFYSVLVLVGFSGTGWGAWVAVDSPIAQQVPTVEVRSASADVWRMDISIPGFTLETFGREGEVYDGLSLPGERLEGREGEVDLPVISRLVALRSGGDPTLEVVSSEWVELEGTYELALDEGFVLGDTDSSITSPPITVITFSCSNFASG